MVHDQASHTTIQQKLAQYTDEMDRDNHDVTTMTIQQTESDLKRRIDLLTTKLAINDGLLKTIGDERDKLLAGINDDDVGRLNAQLADAQQTIERYKTAVTSIARWLYDIFFDDAGVDADEGGEYVTVNTDLGDYVDELTTVVSKPIIDANHQRSDLMIMNSGEWEFPVASIEHLHRIKNDERTNCVNAITEWILRRTTSKR
jgi:uncharacterized protein YaaQ